MSEGVPEELGVSTHLLIGFAVGLAFGVFVYTPGPGTRLRHRLMHRSGEKARQHGQAVVALRVVAGSQDGLTEGWHTGVAVASPGWLVFTHHVGRTPVVKRPVPPIQVIAIGSAEPMRPGDGWFRLDPDTELAPLRTPTGMLQLAVMPPLPAEQVLARLRWPGAPYC
jgi:hypothetical protein